METKANYFLIGLFTLAGILGGLGFLLWLAKVEVDRQYAYYDVLFEDVAGLSEAGDVRYNGLPAGRVVALGIDPDDPSRIRVRLELAGDIPVKTDTVAKLQSQGVTGVTYVALSGGSATATDLPRNGEIRAERSALQSVVESAPELLENAILLLEDIRTVVNDDNRAAVETLLANLASSSGRLDETLAEFQGLSANIGTASAEVAAFAQRLRDLSDTAEVTLTTASDTLIAAQSTIERTEGAITSAETTFSTANDLMQGDLRELIQVATSTAGTLDGAVQTLEPAARATLEAAQTIAEEQAPALINEVIASAQQINAQTSTVGRDLAALIDRYVNVGTALEARIHESENMLLQLEVTAERATGTLDSIQTAADATTKFLETSGKPLADEAAAALAAARNFAETDLPTLVENTNNTLASLDRETTALSESAQQTIALGTQRLQQAEGTLQRLDQALDQADGTLASIETTADGINALVTGDGAALISEAQQTAAQAADTLASLQATSDAAGTFLEDTGQPLADEAIATLSAARTLAETDIPAIIDTTNTTLTTLDREATALSISAQSAIALATDRLAQAEGTLQQFEQAMMQADAALASVTTTSDSINTLVAEDGAALIATARAVAEDTQTAVAEINRAVQDELPGIVADISEAAKTANQVITDVGAAVTDTAGSLDTLSQNASVALDTATVAFTNANDTLDFITTAMAQADTTLSEAELTFIAANRILDEDMGPVIEDLRKAFNTFTVVVDGAADDIDQIGAEVLRASTAAANVTEVVEGIVVDNRRQVSEFLRAGLPQLQKFTEEARMLVVNLERLVDRVERDPARFLLGTQAREFNR